jgi:hypothetical protein
VQKKVVLPDSILCLGLVRLQVYFLEREAEREVGEDFLEREAEREADREADRDPEREVGGEVAFSSVDPSAILN